MLVSMETFTVGFIWIAIAKKSWSWPISAPALSKGRSRRFNVTLNNKDRKTHQNCASSPSVNLFPATYHTFVELKPPSTTLERNSRNSSPTHNVLGVCVCVCILATSSSSSLSWTHKLSWTWPLPPPQTRSSSIITVIICWFRKQNIHLDPPLFTIPSNRVKQ